MLIAVVSGGSGMVDVNRLLTVREAAKQLGFSEYSIRQFIREKKIRATKLRRWRIAPEDLEEFVRSRRNR